jgi:hypothetical protein
LEVSQTLSNAQKIIELAKKEGWSEEELSKAIDLLHSHFSKQIYVF